VEIPSWPEAGEREAELIGAVLESSQWGGFHPFVSQFEQSFAAYQHATYGIAAANGTVTLEVALTVLGLGPDDEVIVPAISFISTATAVSRIGALPVFVDIEPWSFNIDPDRVREAISPKTRAIIAVHFGGSMAQIGRLMEIARDHNLLLIEDAAHAHGSEWNGKRAGSFGICGSFSFQNGKVLSAGEGGMLVTVDEEFAIHARSVVNQGRRAGESFYKHFLLGTNLRLTAFQAAVLMAQFERLPEQIRRRTSNVKVLKKSTSELDRIVWQQEPEQLTQNSYYLLPARVRGHAGLRDSLVGALNEAGAPAVPFYPHTLYQNPLYQAEGRCRVMPCPNAEAYIQDAFWLPHRLLLADSATLMQVVDLIRGALA
jgi:dTDP-4-amino-4,6-dideoxygalactose transaminase